MEIESITVIVGTDMGRHQFCFYKEDIDRIEKELVGGVEYGVEDLIATLLKEWRAKGGMSL